MSSDHRPRAGRPPPCFSFPTSIYFPQHISANTMPQGLQRSISIVLLLGQLITGTLLEISHTDGLVLAGNGNATVSSHDCGSHEIHKPLSASGVCLACAFSLQRNALEIQTYFGPSVQPLGVSAVLHNVISASPLHIYSSGKRGPPAS